MTNDIKWEMRNEQWETARNEKCEMQKEEMKGEEMTNDIKWEMRNEQWETARNEKCEIRNEKWEIRSVKWEIRNANVKWEMRNAKSGNEKGEEMRKNEMRNRRNKDY